MKAVLVSVVAMVISVGEVGAQGLRQVPQRFAYIQPIGLSLGVGQLGVEFAVGPHTTIEIGGVGVYSQEDGIQIYGGGPGVGVRQYFGRGEVGGFVVGARIDGVWLEADNFDATRRFLAIGDLRERDSAIYVGFGALAGYRWVSTSGLFLEPMISYEYFAGHRPLVPGSENLQEELGISLGVAFGVAW